MKRVILAKVEYDELRGDTGNYFEELHDRISQMHLSVSKKREWVEKNGAKVEYQEIKEIDSSTKKLIYYAFVEDVMATEFYLRF